MIPEIKNLTDTVDFSQMNETKKKNFGIRLFLNKFFWLKN